MTLSSTSTHLEGIQMESILFKNSVGYLKKFSVKIFLEKNATFLSRSFKSNGPVGVFFNCISTFVYILISRETLHHHVVDFINGVVCWRNDSSIVDRTWFLEFFERCLKTKSHKIDKQSFRKKNVQSTLILNSPSSFSIVSFPLWKFSKY